MDKRTLFYWSKLYLEGIKKGDDYKQLNKVITINVLDSEFLGANHYHSSFHLWEEEQKDYLLTDLVENVQKVEEKLLYTNKDIF